MVIIERLVWNGRWAWELFENCPGMSARQVKKQMPESDMKNPRFRVRRLS